MAVALPTRHPNQSRRAETSLGLAKWLKTTGVSFPNEYKNPTNPQLNIIIIQWIKDNQISECTSFISLSYINRYLPYRSRKHPEISAGKQAHKIGLISLSIHNSNLNISRILGKKEIANVLRFFS